MTSTLVPRSEPHAAAQADPVQLAAVCERPLDYLPELDYAAMCEESIELSHLTESTRLEQAAEQQLFRQMNLALYQAAQLRDQLRPGDAPQASLDEVLRLVGCGLRIRNRLWIVFRKLAIAIARRFVSPRFPWDELVSEAQATLLYAISKFNPDRGFRFSTYATHAVRRRLARYVRRQSERGEVPLEPVACRLAEARKWTFSYEQLVERRLEVVDGLLRRLTSRERYIIRARFGWGREFEPRTLQQIAAEFGVSRERIRQLEARALQKLRSGALELGIDD